METIIDPAAEIIHPASGDCRAIKLWCRKAELYAALLVFLSQMVIVTDLTILKRRGLNEEYVWGHWCILAWSCLHCLFLPYSATRCSHAWLHEQLFFAMLMPYASAVVVFIPSTLLIWSVVGLYFCPSEA